VTLSIVVAHPQVASLAAKRPAVVALTKTPAFGADL
jgi:hypothetical protein